MNLVWVMLNPSTAGAFEDDPTIRRCWGFTERDGRFGGMVVVNLFGLVATNPDALRAHDDPVGPHNREWVNATMEQAKAVAVAWGASIEGLPAARAERDYVLESASAWGVSVMDLGTTKAGHPRHPLYLRSDTPWRWV